MAGTSLARLDEVPELEQECHFYCYCDWYPLEVLNRESEVDYLIQLTFKNTTLHFDFTTFKPNF